MLVRAIDQLHRVVGPGVLQQVELDLEGVYVDLCGLEVLFHSLAVAHYLLQLIHFELVHTRGGLALVDLLDDVRDVDRGLLVQAFADGVEHALRDVQVEVLPLLLDLLLFLLDVLHSQVHYVFLLGEVFRILCVGR